MKRNQHLVEFVYYISPDDIQYPLFGGKRALLSFAGTGMPDFNYITDTGPFVDGVRVRDFKLDPRIIDLRQYERGCKRQDRWDNLGEISDTVRMNRGGAGKLLFILPDFSEREIEAWILEGPAGNWHGDSGLLMSDIDELLRFFCPYPIFNDPNENELIFTGIVEDSCLPKCLEFCVGTDVVNAIANIGYLGTYESYPTIYIVGPINHPVITNTTTGKEIKFLYDVANGEAITIELSPNQALVYNNFGNNNLIGTVENTNDLATFSIAPQGVGVPGGVNTITVIGSGGLGGLTSVTISYTTKYLTL